MAVSPVSSRMRRMQWIAIGLATAAIALNYVDRSTLAVGNIKIREEFGISATAIGALQSAWSITYALCQVPIGYFLDRLGPRWLVGVALVLWSLAQAAGGLAVSYVQLLWARVALGATECPAFPAAVRVTSDWYHVKDRGRPTGVYNSGGSIGPFIAPPLLTGLMLAFGWRTMFVTMASSVCSARWCGSSCTAIRQRPNLNRRTRRISPRTVRARARSRHATGAGCSSSSRCGA